MADWYRLGSKDELLGRVPFAKNRDMMEKPMERAGRKANTLEEIEHAIV